MIANKSFFSALIGIAALVAITLGLILWNANRGPTFGGELTLTYRGQEWRFSESPRKLNLVYFGYAKCPDVCPLTLSFVGEAFRKLTPDEAAQVRFLFISVDQEHDKPDDVADYALNFFPEFIGLSGSKQQIDAAIKLFPATYIVEKNPKSYLGYSITHTDRVFFLDKNGKGFNSVAGPRDADTIYNAIKENL